MDFLKKNKGKKLHNRNINISTYDYDDQHIIVEGELRDERLAISYNFNKEKQLPGTVHHMIIRLLIQFPGFMIKDVEVEMPGIPRKECVETVKTLDIIKGMNISQGFTLKIKDILGGNKSCVHLTTLLLAMAPAAIQGFWVHLAEKPLKPGSSLKSMAPYIIDTCMIWRSDGPLAAKMIKQYQQNKDN